eukprot:CAMPEP_0172452508 /NCGR_PEP_ID=MMETSP1065-20121228/10146_1 /TAXON_ID=265537 /ORGANISM="Amphiprora paludosa, Strain CCMP125" /LENGTH=787 /DNA_ID=CAMNT_0013204573 /DNA_START=227 /DNA_END=2590 /DNA_ORIENTATION=-
MGKMGLFGFKKPKGSTVPPPQSTRNVMGGSGGSGRGSGRNISGGSTRKPGAQADNGNTVVFKVKIPDGIKPGEEFQVHAGGRVVRVKCPPGASAGQSLAINVPKTSEMERSTSGGSAPGSDRNGGMSNSMNSSNSFRPDGGNPNLPPDSPGVTKMEDSGGGPQAYMVEIPTGVRGGQQFPITIAGNTFMVTCPPHAVPGNKVRIVPPPPDPNQPPLPDGPGSPPTPSPPQPKREEQTFEVTVPNNVQGGSSFALLAGGVRVQVVCPVNAGPGQKIRFRLPLALTRKPKKQTALAAKRLSYDKDGWTRTVRVTDMKLQWIRMDENGGIDDLRNAKFDAEKSAYVRKLIFREGSDPRIRDGILTLVPAHEAVVDSKIRNDRGEVIVDYPEIADAQASNFESKADWFKKTCAQLAVEWNEGHMRINVRREHLLEDSVDAVMSLNRKDLRKMWRFEFIGEAGIDAGGLAREWFHLVSKEIFDPDMGFWLSSESNQMLMEVNPASKMIHSDYLVYYRFLGRVMGKAMFDGQLVAGHMVPFIYKHMLGWPISFKDLKVYDEDYYSNLQQVKQLADTGEDVEMILCMDFTTTVDILGDKQDVELVPGGADKPVTNDNYTEYFEACLKYRMMDRIKPQLNELMLGFFDVIPEPLLTVFDYQELELIMCGLPKIDMKDWREHTEYSGDYEQVGEDYPACVWFWEVVDSFDQEMKARLLQFVTGTSGVPSRGFAVLQGNDGNVRKFTIHGVSVGTCLYPRAHTCFNRIDLPSYETKDDLEEKLKLAVTMVATGFDIE